MILIWSTLTIPKHNIHLFPFFISLSAGRSSLLEFRFDLLSFIWFGAFQIHPVFLVICFRISFFRRDRRFHWSEGNQLIFEDHGSWFRFAGCCWYHEGFFQTTAGVCSDRGHLIVSNFLRFFWSIRQILFTSVPLYYFDVKSVDYLCFQLYLVVHQRIYCLGISSLWL